MVSKSITIFFKLKKRVHLEGLWIFFRIKPEAYGIQAPPGIKLIRLRRLDYIIHRDETDKGNNWLPVLIFFVLFGNEKLNGNSRVPEN